MPAWALLALDWPRSRWPSGSARKSPTFGLVTQRDPKQRVLDEGAEDTLRAEVPALSDCYAGAVTQRLALGPHRDRPVMKMREPLRDYLTSARDRVERAGMLCAHVDGFDLHGRVAFGEHQRARIERLVLYCARPPIANSRLVKLPDSHYQLTLKSRWRDGTTHLRFEPVELMERLAAQIPKPRANLLLYARVLAPNAKLRAEVVEFARTPKDESEQGPVQQTRAERETWSELMRATFALDVLACPKCGGRLRHIATILDAAVARKILAYLGLTVRGPPEGAVRSPPPFWPDGDESW